MDLQQAKEMLTSLADGVDPLTGEILPEDSVCNQVEMVRAFHCILRVLPNSPSHLQPENAGKPWKKEDDELLCIMYDAGNTRKEMSACFKRSRGSIDARLMHLGKIPAKYWFPDKK